MNNFPLTSLFASLFTIFYLFLSFRIGYLRGKHAQKKVTAIKLDRNVRAHGNFSEYVPLFLILLYIFESVDLISFKYLLIICLVFLMVELHMQFVLLFTIIILFSEFLEW